MRRTFALVTVLLAALVATAAATARPTAIATVTVTVTDATLRASSTAPASGKTVFVVVNKGKKTHALRVEGPGVKGAQSTKLKPGHYTKLTVTLRPGAYVLSDPISLGEFNVLYLDVVKAASVGGAGNANTVQPEPQLPPMCGLTYTP